jgi:crotonobetainyl-CoA:carnitine CoA-transferase CaiB-like acyl-CoA transferase
MAQFLSGPSAALRLSDLGARVIKIERPGSGDLCRTLYLTDTDLDGDSTLFHAINRNKESIALDLKVSADLAMVKKLITKADVLIQNFRPGVIERIGLSYEAVRELNPRLVYGSISGYGETGSMAARPGQDLLAQSMSGITWVNGHDGEGPIPLGLSIADMLAGHLLTEGILAALVRRGIHGHGGMVQTSLLEALIDAQFEYLTTYLNDGRRAPTRATFRNANPYLSAPYGIYPTANGYLSLAMMPLPALAQAMPLHALLRYDAKAAFTQRDEIKEIIAAELIRHDTAYWLAQLCPKDIWCAEVLDWPRLLSHDAFGALQMLQCLTLQDGSPVHTTRGPIRIDRHRAPVGNSAPRINQHGAQIIAEFDLHNLQ